MTQLLHEAVERILDEWEPVTALIVAQRLGEDVVRVEHVLAGFVRAGRLRRVHRPAAPGGRRRPPILYVPAEAAAATRPGAHGPLPGQLPLPFLDPIA
jgi:hypothetical protein